MSNALDPAKLAATHPRPGAGYDFDASGPIAICLRYGISILYRAMYHPVDGPIVDKTTFVAWFGMGSL